MKRVWLAIAFLCTAVAALVVFDHYVFTWPHLQPAAPLWQNLECAVAAGLAMAAGIGCCVVYKLSGAAGWRMTPPVINLTLAALVTGWMLDYPREYRNFTIRHGAQIRAALDQRARD